MLHAVSVSLRLRSLPPPTISAQSANDDVQAISLAECGFASLTEYADEIIVTSVAIITKVELTFARLLFADGAIIRTAASAKSALLHAQAAVPAVVLRVAQFESDVISFSITAPPFSQ